MSPCGTDDWDDLDDLLRLNTLLRNKGQSRFNGVNSAVLPNSTA